MLHFIYVISNFGRGHMFMYIYIYIYIYLEVLLLIKYCPIKHVTWQTIHQMVDIKVDMLQLFAVLLIKNQKKMVLHELLYVLIQPK